MPRGRKKPSSPLFLALQSAASGEREAVEFLEARRWNGSPACPRCGSGQVYAMTDRATGERNKDYRWRCKAEGCNRMFTVRTGALIEESRLPLRVWCHAIWRASASKKGVSALQISRECAISYKSALFLLHRIRRAMGEENGSAEKLQGTVEADECYVGGAPRRGSGVHNKRGRSTRKTPVFGVVERDGKARLKVHSRVTSKNLKAALLEYADQSARLITDEFPHYIKAGKAFAGGHETVKHADGEYARGDIHSNTVESLFSLIKRGMFGTFHSVSKKHLPRYLDEFAFRYNARKVSDEERVEHAIRAAVGKRLTYQDQLDGR